MTKPSTIRLLGVLAIAGWVACYFWSVGVVSEPDATAKILSNLVLGFAASVPFVVSVGFALTESGRGCDRSDAP